MSATPELPTMQEIVDASSVDLRRFHDLASVSVGQLAMLETAFVDFAGPHADFEYDEHLGKVSKGDLRDYGFFVAFETEVFEAWGPFEPGQRVLSYHMPSTHETPSGVDKYDDSVMGYRAMAIHARDRELAGVFGATFRGVAVMADKLNGLDFEQVSLDPRVNELASGLMHRLNPKKKADRFDDIYGVSLPTDTLAAVYADLEPGDSPNFSELPRNKSQ